MTPDDPSALHGRRREAPRADVDEDRRRRDAAMREIGSVRSDVWPLAPLAVTSRGSAMDGRSQGDTAEADVEPVGDEPRIAAARTFRPELQGLRAVAILMVVCYHVWFDRVSGGVDIFLLISAFLLTGSFARKLESGRPLAVPQYWLHAFKRLVPPAALVILLTVVATIVILPVSRWRETAGESIASLLYAENWLLAARSVDYYAVDHSTASPLQHFWSLSIQGQVFLVWPLLFLLTAVLVRRFHLPARATMLVIFGVIAAVSFAWSVYLTSANQTLAYFDTRTRLWEFALGSLLAVALPIVEHRLSGRDVRHPFGHWTNRARAFVGWLGLVLIVACGWLVDVQGAFPGWIALWPLLSASLVIATGSTGTRWGADRLLSSRPLQWFGDISYALYLVHWPILIFTLVVLEVGHLTPGQGFLVVLASIGLAWAVTRFVDAPIRHSAFLDRRWWRSGLVIVTSIALVTSATWTWQHLQDRRVAYIEAHAAVNNPGARSLEPGFVYEGAADPEPIPAFGERSEDWAWKGMSRWCADNPTVPPNDLWLVQCVHQVVQEKPTRRVIAVGNSHTDQWLPGLQRVAEDQGWDLLLLHQPACFFTSDADNTSSQDCIDWLHRSEAVIEQWSPDTLVIQSTMTTYDGTGEIIRDGTLDQVTRWTSAGINVVGIRDNPRFPTSHQMCEDEERVSSCTFDHVAANSPDPTSVWESEVPGYAAVDMNDIVCPSGRCPSTVGNVYVYLDDNHITATYARSTAHILSERLVAALTRNPV